MLRAVTARLVRRSDREQVRAYLALDPLGNLLLLDQVARLGSLPASGEMRGEVAVARRGDAIVGVMGLRPTVVFDAAVAPEAIDAFLPFVESFGVGLVKSAAGAVDRLWERLARRVPSRAIVDRGEIAYVLRPAYARLRDLAGRTAARPASGADLDALVIAARESLCEEGRPDPFSGDVRGFRRWVSGRVARARVIESEGRVVFVAYADVQRPEGWLVQGVYTWPELRGRGLATAGVSDLCREAFAAGTDHVQLAVVEDNVPGVRLYERLGFKPFTRLRTILFAEA
jgi:ribosomal protein S18 acetylase RimI-like enzyme